MLTILFVLAVVIGFIAMFLSTFPVAYAARVAWGSWLIAAVLWAIPQVGGH